MGDEVLLTVDDHGVARLTLNRPDAANAIDFSLSSALAEAASSLRARDDVRAVLLSGAGDRFCGGGDVKTFAASEGVDETLRTIVDRLHEAIEDLYAIGAPIVAAVQGSAAGAGLSLMTGADLVVAAASTKFVMAYTAIALSPDGGSTYVLPRMIGVRRALELALTNRVLSADEALEWGLVTQVVPDAELTNAAEALVQQLAAGPTRAFATAKRLMRASLANDLKTQLADEADGIVAAGRTADAREGVTAFVEKRPPKFRGA